MNQLNLFSPPKIKKEHGGSLQAKGKRKTKRPLSTKHPMHLVLRAEQKTLMKDFIYIESYIEKFARRFHIKIYRKATCSNHIHFLIQFSDRKNYQRFVRALSGTLAKTLKIKWQLYPYTRIISWGREFRVVQSYVVQNIMEALNFVPYKPRGRPVSGIV